MNRAGSGSGGKPGGSGRPITPDESELWELATRSLDPVPARKRRARAPAAPAAKPAPAPPPRQTAPPAPAPRPAMPPAVKPHPKAKPPPIADFDRRAARQIAAGRIEIDARLDLHGDRQRDAHPRLREFLLSAHANGARTVLVITGKGDDRPVDPLAHALGEPRRGVLRRLVPQWLSEPELRAVVISFTTANARHGGDGALYVQLRRPPRER